jgi:hypothetical protein
MEEQGFRLVDETFTYAMELNQEVDVAVSVRQGFPYSKVSVAEFYINLGVLHKELAELEAIFTKAQMPTSPPPHWCHSTRQGWQISKNLNSLVAKKPLLLTAGSSEEEISTVVDSIVTTVVQFGLPLARRFDNIQSLVQELESPTDLSMKCQGLMFKLPLAYLLNGQFDSARLSLSHFKEELSASGITNVYFSRFERNLETEITRREGLK